MNNWYEELVKECETAHDKECEHGEECPERTSHIERVFVRHALKDRVVTLQARLAAVEELHTPVDSPGCDDPECCDTTLLCVECLGLWPCETIKVIKGAPK